MSYIYTGFKKNFSNRASITKEREEDYPIKMLCFGIIVEAVKEYYEYERKLKALDLDNSKSKVAYKKKLRKKMQETLDFFETPVGNSIAFGLGKVLIESIKEHTIDLNKLRIFLKR